MQLARLAGAAALLLASSMALSSRSSHAQAPGPSLVSPDLRIRVAAEGLVTPITIAFLGPDDFLVLEKDTGRVRRVTGGVVGSTVLDLAVNAASERGLLGIALHPDFPANPGVYLYWTCRAAVSSDPFRPAERECADPPALGADTTDLLAVPLLGNRVDRFRWDGATLTFERNLVKLLAFQNDAAPTPGGQDDSTQPPRGNHDGGVIAFGPDRKIYVMVGDLGRRGMLQNLPSGPRPARPDDQFGGPEPDAAHLAGVVLRLNEDGSAPSDNPFFALGNAMGGDMGESLRKIYCYGIRNSFGMAFDPRSGALWDQENGEDAFDEINRLEAGMNSGWIQLMGPAARVNEYRTIETTSLHHEDTPNLQQLRWGPERIAESPRDASARLLVLPGSHYADPEFSWKHVLAPAAIGFLDGRTLGADLDGDLFVGMSVPEPLGGPIFRFKLTADRRRIAPTDSRLEDRVADNPTFHDMAESESLLFGQDFGVVTDIETAPGGTLYVVSLSAGAVYEIHRR
jgi:glucose/arabinose dehydrogenase